jgi:hypothetical protein
MMFGKTFDALELYRKEIMRSEIFIVFTMKKMAKAGLGV